MGQTHPANWKPAPQETREQDEGPAPSRRPKPPEFELLFATAKAVDSPQCTTAKLNASLLAGSSALQQDTDGDGKPDTVLDDTGRENQRNLAEAAVKAYCTSAGT